MAVVKRASEPPCPVVLVEVVLSAEVLLSLLQEPMSKEPVIIMKNIFFITFSFRWLIIFCI
jgi:hypothetical protein